MLSCSEISLFLCRKVHTFHSSLFLVMLIAPKSIDAMLIAYNSIDAVKITFPMGISNTLLWWQEKANVWYLCVLTWFFKKSCQNFSHLWISPAPFLLQKTSKLANKYLTTAMSTCEKSCDNFFLKNHVNVQISCLAWTYLHKSI